MSLAAGLRLGPPLHRHYTCAGHRIPSPLPHLGPIHRVGSSCPDSVLLIAPARPRSFTNHSLLSGGVRGPFEEAFRGGVCFSCRVCARSFVCAVAEFLRT